MWVCGRRDGLTFPRHPPRPYICSNSRTDWEDSWVVNWGGAEGWREEEPLRRVLFFLNKGAWQQKEAWWKVRSYHVGLNPILLLTSCVALSTILNHSEPLSPLL